MENNNDIKKVISLLKLLESMKKDEQEKSLIKNTQNILIKKIDKEVNN